MGEGEGRRGPQGSGSSGELPGQRDGGRPAQRAVFGGSGQSLAGAGGAELWATVLKKGLESASWTSRPTQPGERSRDGGGRGGG